MRRRFLHLLTAAILLAGGCSDDDTAPHVPVMGLDHAPLVGVGAFTGTVDGAATVGGATVTLGDRVTTVDAYGRFEFPLVPAGRRLLTITHPDHLEYFAEVAVVADQTASIGVIDLWNWRELDLDQAVDRTVSEGGGVVTIRAGSVVDANGELPDGRLLLRYRILSSGGARNLVYRGRRADGEEVALAIGAQANLAFASEHGEPLQLADGAEIGLAVYAWSFGTGDPRPTELPVWRFDLDERLWIEHGTATLEEDAYVASLPATGRWSVAQPAPELLTFTGRVVDLQGAAVADAWVRYAGSNPGYAEVTWTDDDGRFAVHGVAGQFGRIEVRAQGSPREYVWFSDETTGFELPEPLVIEPPVFRVTLVWSADPPDLDLHLLVPAGADTTGLPDHVYYGAPGERNLPPFCEFDRDASGGRGPESITGHALVDGRYQIWVHDHSGPAGRGLPASGALVQVVHGGAEQTDEIWGFEVAGTPPPGEALARWWHVADLAVADGVATVVPVDRFAEPPALLAGARAAKRRH